MQDQPSTCDDNGEPRPRPRSIPDDFIWDPEEQAWYPPGEPAEDFATYWARRCKELDEEYGDIKWEGPHLITVDDLRAAGALDCPPELRKSLRNKPTKPTKRTKPEQLPLFGDDDTLPTKQPPTPSSPDGDVSAEEPS